MTHNVEPELGRDRPCFIYNFPASQAALARINPDDPIRPHALKFIITAWSLLTAFMNCSMPRNNANVLSLTNVKREALQQPIMPIDELFISALAAGLPDCSGVALGVDRLVMLALRKDTLQEITSFPIERV